MRRAILTLSQCLSVAFLISLCICNCNTQKSCFTSNHLYGFCERPLNNHSLGVKNHYCDENETCCPFERSLNNTGKNILLRLKRDCGKPNNNHIAGGINATLMEFPWMAILNGASGELCAGTLISHRWVLTAAHCIKEPMNTVILGEYNMDSEPDCPRTSRFRPNQCAATKTVAIEKYIKHPEYNLGQLKRDIGLIKLSEHIKFTNSIAPVCLPVYQHHTEAQTGDILTITGWGLTEKGHASAILQKANVALLETSECAKHYKRTGINRSHACAMGKPNVGTCHGDSGGPLIKMMKGETNRKSKKIIQLGVISMGGPSCGSHPFPYPYSSVVDAMPWITSIIDS